MTRLELLQLLVARARSNGFEFKRWYITRLGLPWISAEAALRLLEQQRRYYALIFAHEFATTFWKPGSEISFDVPAQTFQKVMKDGSVRTVRRKPFIRRTLRAQAWRYHLREMALAEEPLRYLRKYLHIEEQLDAELEVAAPEETQPKPPKKTAGKRSAKPLPQTPPAFLLRPYPGNDS